MNTKQKNGVIATTALLLLLIGLHNPFAGYVTEIAGTSSPHAGFLTRSLLERTSELEFLDWYSSGALFSWIRTIREVIGFCFLVLVLGVAIVLMNRSSGKSE
jgi:hypothetical protein